MPSEDDRDDDAQLTGAVLDGLGSRDGLPRLAPELAAAFDTVRNVMSAFESLGVGPPRAHEAPARTWGPFALQEEIGRGTFGVVCRAVDPAVGRDIAVKLYSGADLPAEPRLLARVRHPNVVTVFGAAVHDGRAGIWMELVRGRSLAERVRADGVVSHTEARRIGVELCAAVRAVHEAQLLHLDIKPRNVMEGEGGRIVLMDFGAGRSEEARPASSGVSGTPLFMAPEVVLGEAPSPRADLYSIGVLLYYLLTGTYPVYATDAVELRQLHERHRNRSPRPFAAALRELRPEVPSALAACVARALSPVERRYRSAAEFGAALEAVQSGRATASTFPKVLTFRVPVWLAIGAVVVGGLAGAAFRRPEHHPPVTSRRLTWDAGLTIDPAVSSGGRFIAYASDRAGHGDLDVWVQQTAGGPPLRLTDDPADESQPSFSPDGSHVVFRSEKGSGGLFTVPTLGGAVQPLSPDGFWPRYSPDGRWIAYAGRGDWASFFVMPAGGGTPQELPVHARGGATPPVWSEDSRHLLVLGVDPRGSLDAWDWWTVTLTDAGVMAGPATPAGASALFGPYSSTHSQLQWSAPGSWIQDEVTFAAPAGDAMALWSVRLPVRSRKIAGPPRQLAIDTGSVSQPVTIPGGPLVFSTLSGNESLWEVPLDAAGRARGAARVLVANEPYEGLHSLSADGRRLVFVSRRLGRPDLWVRDLESGVEKALTATPAVESYPVISRDGTRVVYEASTQAGSILYEVAASGGLPREICHECGWPTDWSADGRFVVLQHRQTAHAWLGVLDRKTGVQAEILSHAEYTVYRGHISPDGRWIVFHTARLGSTREFVAPFRGLTPVPYEEWIPLTSGEHRVDAPRWSPDGKSIVYVSDRDGFLCVWEQPLNAATGRPVGDPIAIQHWHQRQLSIANVYVEMMDLALAPGRLVLNLGELRGNIWAADVSGGGLSPSRDASAPDPLGSASR
jgi:Tol biopolymer transport system component